MCPRRPHLQACELELRDCAPGADGRLEEHNRSRVAFEGADWIILLGGKPTHPDIRNRLDLLRQNAPIMVEHGRAINQVAPTARILVVTSPSNANCMVAKSQAVGVPASHWFALTHVHRMRAMALIAEKGGVPPSLISRVTVWGNNSENAFIDLHAALIGERPALEVINDPRWVNHVLGPTIAGRANEIYRLRGSMPAGSIAQAILGTVRSIITPTPFGRWFAAGSSPTAATRFPAAGLRVPAPDGRWKDLVHRPQSLPGRDGRRRIAANVAEIQHEATAVNDRLGTI